MYNNTLNCDNQNIQSIIIANDSLFSLTLSID